MCVVCSVMSNTLRPMHCRPPSFSVHGILQARILEWVAISYSRASSQPRDRTSVFWVSCIGRQIVNYCATWNTYTDPKKFLSERQSQRPQWHQAKNICSLFEVEKPRKRSRTWRRPDYMLCARDTPATNMSVDRAQCDNGDVRWVQRNRKWAGQSGKKREMY